MALKALTALLALLAGSPLQQRRPPRSLLAQQPKAPPKNGLPPGTQCFNVSWTTLARSNQTFGSGTWGALRSERGKLIAQFVASDSPRPEVPLTSLAFNDTSIPKSYKPPKGVKVTNAYSVGPDIPTVHSPKGDTASYMVNHFESNLPSTMYISKLEQDKAGNLKIVDTRHIDGSSVGGFWFTCSGIKTPWGSHLSSEEYPPDCRAFEDYFETCKVGPDAAANVCGIGGADTDYRQNQLRFPRYWGFYANSTKYDMSSVDFLHNQTVYSKLFKAFKCYNYGATPEVEVLAGGKTKVKKWHTLGRLSHELTIVMPDNRTAYMSDDASNGVLLKYVADKAAPDSRMFDAGTLYAAKLSNQRVSKANQYEWDVSWIRLGHASQAELEKMIPTLRWHDMFEVVKPVGNPPACPKGFNTTNYFNPAYKIKVEGKSVYLECVRLKPGMETAAAFFEPRRLAAMLNASTEFEKSEGITFDHVRNRVYLAQAKVTSGLTSDVKYNYGSTNDIDLPENLCGGVAAFDADKDYSLFKATLIFYGDNDKNTDKDNTCDPERVAGPDNLHYAAGVLIVNEDTEAHKNNVMWAYNPDDGSLTRILSAPVGAEVSGVYTSFVGDKAYITVAVQHPFGDEVAKTEEMMNAQRGYVGYIGPLPASVVNDDHVLKFDPIPIAKGDDQRRIVTTSRICAVPAKKA